MPDCPAQGVHSAIPSSYNFGPIHKTLHVTPAMAAGVAQHVWSFEKLVGLLDAAEKKAV